MEDKAEIKQFSVPILKPNSTPNMVWPKHDETQKLCQVMIFGKPSLMGHRKHKMTQS